MKNILNYILNFTTNAEKVTASVNRLDSATINVSKAAIKVDTVFTKTINNINSKISTIHLSSLIQNIGAVADGFQSINQPGIQLNSSLADLQAITGVSNQKLQELEASARKNAKTFGGSASQSIESYKLLLSQLTPDLAKAPKALNQMGVAVSTLSKTMGGDTAAATEVLTTAMNQYKISTEDPLKASKEMARLMNIMAAAAKEGSAELPQQRLALQQSGMAAKAASLRFEEHAAAIQILDKAGKKGAEGGVALRNSLAILSQGRFLPKQTRDELAAAGVDINILADTSLDFTQRLKPLRKIMGDTALVSKLFGRENSNAALALISGIEAQEQLKLKITGTNTAYEQAAVVMESTAEKNARLKARVDDFKISLFNATSGSLGYLNVLGDISRDVGNLLPVFAGFGKVLGFVTNLEKLKSVWTGILAVKTAIMTAAQWALNIALNANPIGLVIIGITALIGLVTLVVKKYEDWGAALSFVLGPFGLVVNMVMSFKRHWDSITKAFKEEGIIGGLKRIGLVMLDSLLMPVQ